MLTVKEKPYHGLKKGDQVYARINDRPPVTQQLSQNMDNLLVARKRMIWELSDVQKELESLSIDEE